MGIDLFVFIKFDVFDGFELIELCVGYEFDGVCVDYLFVSFDV